MIPTTAAQHTVYSTLKAACLRSTETQVFVVTSYRSLPFRLVKSISSTPNANLSWIKHFGGMNTFNDG